jgi:hypothetical protein
MQAPGQRDKEEMMRHLVLILVATLCSPLSATAQARQGRVEIRAGAALALASTSVGGESSSDLGGLLTGQLGLVLSSRTDLTADLVVQPFKAQNPLFDEAFTAVYALLGVQLGLGEQRRVYVRPELGLVHRSWSGSEKIVSSETSGAGGFALGGEVAVSRAVGLAPEVFVRLSGAEGLSTALWGLSVSVVPIGARQRAH